MVKHEKVPKYYENDCRFSRLILFAAFFTCLFRIWYLSQSLKDVVFLTKFTCTFHLFSHNSATSRFILSRSLSLLWPTTFVIALVFFLKSSCRSSTDVSRFNYDSNVSPILISSSLVMILLSTCSALNLLDVDFICFFSLLKKYRLILVIKDQNQYLLSCRPDSFLQLICMYHVALYFIQLYHFYKK